MTLLYMSFGTYFSGLGEVSESLLKDDSLTPADFLDDRNAFLDISTSQQNLTSCNDCLSSPKTVDCNEFKTPRTSRYMHKISETPCLFSQDESINHTPTSSKWFCFVQKYETQWPTCTVQFVMVACWTPDRVVQVWVWLGPLCCVLLLTTRLTYFMCIFNL